MMSRRVIASVCFAVVGVLALSACTDARRTLGMERKAPDEFAVVSRAPLAVPPDFRLRPPTPGATRPQEGTTSDMARSALFGNNRSAVQRDNVSQGELALLQHAGTDQALPDIRETVDRETSQLTQEDITFTDRLAFWRDPEPYGTMVDADAEARRLRANQALGHALGDGDTPTIERRRRALLEGVFRR